MLGRWLHRGSIGQILAPDPSKKEEEEREELTEFTGGIWSIIAPDINFQSPSREIEKTDQKVRTNTNDNDEKVSQHNPFTPTKEQNSNQQQHQDYENVKVENLVMSAAKDLASCVASPPAIWEDHKKLFNFCASSTALNEKQLKRVKKMLKKNPSLVNCRASKMGFLIPDGFTPLHAAAFVGNYDVALILIDFEISNDSCKQEQENDKVYAISLDTRDVQGRTALHIASEQGHIKLVQLLKAKMTERDPNKIQPIGENAPIDLTGRTPLGWAATSSEPMAYKNINELRMELFSPGDKSVYGRKTPAANRTGGKRDKKSSDNIMDISYGFADMPGHRIEMEDAICHAFPLSLGNKIDNSSSIEVGFFGVFDGHGDGGISSKYIADNIVQCLTTTNEWSECNGENDNLVKALSKSCCDIDIDLKAMLDGSSVKNGGSTGIMALVTPTAVIVGNVGDSRCILVRSETEEDDLAEVMEQKLTIEEGMENPSKSEPQARQSNPNENAIKVIALSSDHKPNLPREKERIEKAGLEVIEETFESEENDKVISIWKIKKGARDKIAVSRAFGDFDYKANEDLKSEEQAIICVPEITVHKRDYSNDMYLVLACDGVFDVMSNDEVGNFVAAKASERKQYCTNNNQFSEVLPEVGDDLLKHCLELGSSDNMSVLIVALQSSDERFKDRITKKVLFADV